MASSTHGDAPSRPGESLHSDDQQLKSENFRHLAKALPETVWSAEPDGTINLLSAQWSHFAGVAEDDPDYLAKPPILDQLRATVRDAPRAPAVGTISRNFSASRRVKKF